MSVENKAITLQQAKTLYDDLRERQESSAGALDGKAPVIINTATGNPAVFSDGADGLPIQSLKVHLLPRQEGTGDPSPENVRNIIPWSGLTVFGGGKNLFNKDDPNVQLDKRVATNGTIINSQYSQAVTGFIPVKAGEKYMINTYVNQNYFSCFYSEKDITQPVGSIFANNEFPKIAPNGAKYLIVTIGNTGIDTFQLEVGQTATAYEPYIHVTETEVTLPSAICGGIPDIVSGTIMVTHVCLDLHKSDFTQVGTNGAMPYRQTPIGFIIQHKPKSRVDLEAARQQQKINCAVIANPYSETAYGEYIGVCLWDTAVPTTVRISQSVYDAIGENDVISICYEIDDPFEVQLTSAQLQSLLGNNTIWSNANGDIEIKYRADTNKFIEEAIVNQPHAGNNGIHGIMAPGAGLSVLNDRVVTNPAGTQSIKAGTSTNLIISPAFVGDATFYGLARAAGVDMANSSNPVGQFTDEAKIAIQKMLGIYEAPWELIREDTVTNETADDVIINVDGNGQSFELTDLILQIKVPLNTNTVIGSYGLVHLFYYVNSDTYIPAMLNAFSGPKQHDWFASVYVKREKNSLMVDYAPYSESGNNRTKNVRNQFDFNYGITQIIKILLRNVQGTITYKLYGKRKWN